MATTAAATATVRRRGSPVTVARTRALVHHLSAATAATPADLPWLCARVRLFGQVVGRSVRLVVTAGAYEALSGTAVHPMAAGHVCLRVGGAVLERPVLYLNPGLIRDRGEAEQVIAHEFMHVGRPSLGHKAQAFAFAQRVLDQVGGDASAARPVTAD
jgi:hypothetical protein